VPRPSSFGTQTENLTVVEGKIHNSNLEHAMQIFGMFQDSKLVEMMKESVGDIAMSS
jgi:hypothetical protein